MVYRELKGNTNHLDASLCDASCSVLEEESLESRVKDNNPHACVSSSLLVVWLASGYVQIKSSNAESVRSPAVLSHEC